MADVIEYGCLTCNGTGSSKGGHMNCPDCGKLGKDKCLNLIPGLNRVARLIADNAVGKGFRVENPDPAALSTFTANLHGEVSELWEAYRAGTIHEFCDKTAKMNAVGLPGLTCIEEELADVIIRVLDTAVAYGVDIEKAVTIKHRFNLTRPYKHGGKRA